MEHHDERGIETAEIAGDLLEEIAREEDMDAYYLDWCERNGVTPSLEIEGEATDAGGDTVRVWRFV